MSFHRSELTFELTLLCDVTEHETGQFRFCAIKLFHSLVKSLILQKVKSEGKLTSCHRLVGQINRETLFFESLAAIHKSQFHTDHALVGASVVSGTVISVSEVINTNLVCGVCAQVLCDKSLRIHASLF